MGPGAEACLRCVAYAVAGLGTRADTTRSRSMDTQRLILLFIFSFSLLMLWEAWERESRPKPAPAPQAQQGVPAPAKPAAPDRAPAASPAVSPGADPSAHGEVVRVSTDLIVAEVDSLGGTLRRVELVRHKDSRDRSKNLVLLGPEHRYVAQSGITGDAGPNHRTPWRILPGERALAPGRETVELRLVEDGHEDVLGEHVLDQHLAHIGHLDARVDGLTAQLQELAERLPESRVGIHLLCDDRA